MKTHHSIAILSVVVALAFASTAQADRWGQDVTKTFAVNHSTTQVLQTARLRAQGMLSGFRRVHGATPSVPSVVICPEQAPGDSAGYCTLERSESPGAPTTDGSLTDVTNDGAGT